MEKGMRMMKDWMARVGVVEYHLLCHYLVEHG